MTASNVDLPFSGVWRDPATSTVYVDRIQILRCVDWGSGFLEGEAFFREFKAFLIGFLEQEEILVLFFDKSRI